MDKSICPRCGSKRERRVRESDAQKYWRCTNCDALNQQIRKYRNLTLGELAELEAKSVEKHERMMQVIQTLRMEAQL